MDELDADRPFPHRRGDALYAGRTRVADAKDSRDAGLHEQGAAGEGPVGQSEIVGQELAAGSYELLVVDEHAALDEARIGIRAGHQEQIADAAHFPLAGFEPPPADALETVFALE